MLPLLHVSCREEFRKDSLLPFEELVDTILADVHQAGIIYPQLVELGSEVLNWFAA